VQVIMKENATSTILIMIVGRLSGNINLKNQLNIPNDYELRPRKIYWTLWPFRQKSTSTSGESILRHT